MTPHNLSIVDSPFRVDFNDGFLTGKSVINASKYIRELSGIFENEHAFNAMDGSQLVYSVQAILPVEEGREGGLFYGKTIIEPGKVGDEYFMTKGHFHLNADRAEFYWGIQGPGMLLLMNEQRKIWAENMFPGSLHYIDGHIAHRTVNTGNIPLIFGACWPSDAGHNYQEIQDNGFSGRLKEVNGVPQLVPSQN